MAADRGVERGPGADPEPGLEDGRGRPAVARRPLDDQLVALVAADPRARATTACRAPRRRPGPGAAARGRARSGRPRATGGRPGGRGRPLASRCRRIQVSRSARNAATIGSGRAQPRRPAGGIETTTPRSGTIVTRSRRDGGPAQHVGQVATRQAGDRVGLDGDLGGGRAHGRGPQSPRRRSRPGRSPVSRPSRTAGRPFTITSRIPAGWTAGRS